MPSPTPERRATLRADRRAFVTGLAGLAWAALASPARADETTSLLESIRRARKNVRTVVGSFEQRRHLGLLATDVVSRGRLLVVLPDQLRWELFPPDSVRVWVSQGTIAYESGQSRGQSDKSAVGPLSAVLEDLLAATAGDPSRLGARYELRASRLASGQTRLIATPLGDAGSPSVRRVQLDLERDQVAPHEILLEESSSDWVRIRFDAVQLNAQVDPALMRPPAAR